MAWTAPRTWVNGELVTDTLMNTHVRDNLSYLKGGTGTIAFDAGAAFAGSVVATAAGNNQGVLSALSGSSSALAGIGVGRTANEVQMAIAAASAQFFTGSAAGDGIVRTISGSQKTMIGSGSTATLTLGPGPLVGIGRTAPQGVLHAYDTISGFIKYEFDGLDGTARTVIPDGAGDVLYGIMPIWAIRASDGTTQGGAYSTGGTALLAPSGTLNIYSSGANTVQLQCAANGSVTVQRTGGSLTYKVSLLLQWL